MALFASSIVFALLAAPGTFEVKLPANVPSEAVAIRYALIGAFGAYVNQVPPSAGQRSYTIATNRQGQQATQLKAILYSPGCAFRLLATALTSIGQHSLEYTCEPLPTVPLTGILTEAEDLLGHAIEIRVKYVAYWVPDYLGYRDGLVATIPAGIAYPKADGHFSVSLPDFASDQTASTQERAGVFQFWAWDKATGNLLAQLVPAGTKLRFGSLKVDSHYAPDLIFTPCLVRDGIRKQHNGFAVRPLPDGCGR